MSLRRVLHLVADDPNAALSVEKKQCLFAGAAHAECNLVYSFLFYLSMLKIQLKFCDPARIPLKNKEISDLLKIKKYGIS